MCSDSRACIHDVSNLLVDSTIFAVSDLNYADGRPIHMDSSLTAARVNVDMFSDLIAMAHARRLLYINTVTGIPSGFSVLAESLLRSRELVAQLMAV